MGQRLEGRKNISKFEFIPVLPGSGETGPIVFEAHIVGLTDTSSPGWEEAYDMGRPDPKMMFKSINRSVNIAFVMFSFASGEHSKNYFALQKLGNLTYPIYKAKEGYNAPHVKFEIGKLLSGHGVVTGIDYSWQPDTPRIQEKPILTEVNVTIKVLTDFHGKRPNYNGGSYLYFGKSVS